MDKSGGRERRRHYRLRYPDTDHPILQTYVNNYTVMEISEGGIRIFEKDTGKFRMGDRIRGKMKMKIGHILEIEGKVIRIYAQEIVVLLFKSIPTRYVMDEQRYIIQHHPNPKGKLQR